MFLWSGLLLPFHQCARLRPICFAIWGHAGKDGFVWLGCGYVQMVLLLLVSEVKTHVYVLPVPSLCGGGGDFFGRCCTGCKCFGSV